MVNQQLLPITLHIFNNLSGRFTRILFKKLRITAISPISSKFDFDSLRFALGGKKKEKKWRDEEENTNETFRGIFRESVMETVEGVKNEEEIRRKVGGTPTELSIRDR